MGEYLFWLIVKSLLSQRREVKAEGAGSSCSCCIHIQEAESN